MNKLSYVVLVDIREYKMNIRDYIILVKNAQLNEMLRIIRHIKKKYLRKQNCINKILKKDLIEKRKL